MATRDDFVNWMNRSGILSKISQRPRSIREWADDFAKALELYGEAEDTKPPPAKRELGMNADPGSAGVFGAPKEQMGLVDPELADDDEEETW